ncbi:MATE family efflux transporter [Bariatricus massiliensis]|uniref:Multidrug export protein MepA n=1 Tax=Bariatricus massiliensis TaxID=1745713 RepID=A0ABS8DMC1_9FIRM|nr:MATE family efflux transporter [Bariatricus massiliensis]MCB7305726.1 MATE family efflux transporter [Bariatricus massiliensis]MCB7376357.1 MATE family efflux transporter [Bariatricus massiliensis]MCB7388869.1 MATE family efflux transporter [Bariatricus massiliensis]MCB7413042.1 MATE family efflux transporter [Bariatricus massiliensis]MCQ5255013.1 MATE family efflux transporter [Bariatricus massiliensis]
MQEQNKKMKLLDSAPVPKALLALGLPTMIGMLINALYNLADSYFVGGLGTAQLGALTVAYPLGQIIVGLGLLYGNGAASCLSRQLGQGDMENAEKTASTALYSSICTGAAVIACCLIFLKPLLEMLGASTTVMPYAVTYTSIYIVFSLFNVFNVTMNNIVSSEGAAKTTMCVLMAGAALNVVLDPLFIYVLDFGIAGAAIATGISQFVSTLIYIIYIVRKKSVFTFNVKNFCPSKTIMSEILKIGIPTLVFQLLTSLSMSLVNDGAKAYGDSALAAMGPVTKMMSVGSLMVFGFLKGLQPIAGYSYGAKKYERLHKTIKLSIIWSTIFCAVFGLTVAVFSSSIISGFTQNDTEMIRVGQTALRANGLSFVLFGFYTVYSSLFLALGKAREGCFLGACRQGICFVPLILILPALCGLKGILYAQPAADVISAVITVFMALHLHRKLNAEIMK